ncbi:hypothetical protein [Nocardiopsis sp. M1B1]
MGAYPQARPFTAEKLTYVVTQAPYRDALAEAIPLVRAREGAA